MLVEDNGSDAGRRSPVGLASFPSRIAMKVTMPSSSTRDIAEEPRANLAADFGTQERRQMALPGESGRHAVCLGGVVDEMPEPRRTPETPGEWRPARRSVASLRRGGDEAR